jgi:hypothetical protein
MKVILQRTCIGCNKKNNKADLLRIVKNKNGDIAIDETGKMQGRGLYICKNIECLNSAIKKRKMERNFSCKIEESIYENIRGVISGK